MDDGVGFGTFVLGMFVVAFFAGCVLVIYKRSLSRHIHTALREEVMLEVQYQMVSYQPLPAAPRKS